MKEKKVLLIDDEMSLQRSLALGLMQKGYDTEACESGMCGLKALEALKKGRAPIHYVVLDVRLPDIDGLKLLKVIKFNYPDIPVIVITGYGSETTEADARSEKADAYLEKPFTVDELAETFAAIPQRDALPLPAKEESLPSGAEKSVSAYVLLNFADSADLSTAYQELYFLDKVLYCDAIKGDFDLALLLQAGKMSEIQAVIDDKIKKLAGVREVVYLPVAAPGLSDNAADIIATFDKALGRDRGAADATNNASFSRSASSYVFLEIEKKKLDTIFPSLYINEQVVSCDSINGKFDIVLLMQGTSFAEIDRNIAAKIRPLDGVLRIKETPIIKLFEM